MNNKRRVAKKASVFGGITGALISISIFNTSTIILPFLLAISSCRRKLRKRDLGIFFLWLFIVVWILLKSLAIGGIGTYLLQDLLWITVLATFTLLKIKRFIIFGTLIALVPIFLLDTSCNFQQLAFGNDLFGNIPDSVRGDGVRLTGMVGHSFVSLGLYLSIFLLFQAAGYKKLILNAPIYLMLFVGSFRAYIFPLILPIYRFLFRKCWSTVFLFSLTIALVVAFATFFSVASGILSESSGNAFRIIAWKAAFEEIAIQPLFGITVPPPPFPENWSLTEHSLSYYQIYESRLLQDAVRYGLPLAFMKLTFFYYTGKSHYQKFDCDSTSLARAKNFIVAFMITDYVMFSYFSMPLVALVSGVILATSEKNLYCESQALL